MLKTITKLLAGSTALALTAGAAFAADLPSRRAPAPYVAVPVFTWTGFYAGVNAGYGFADNDRNNFAGVGAVPVPGGGFAPAAPLGTGGFGTGGSSNDGFVGGGQVGYNYQFGAGSGFVVGVEGDIQYTDFGRRNNNNGGGFATAIPQPTGGVAGLGIAAPVVGSAGNVALFNNTTGRSDFYGSIRGRVGYAFDRVLVYATGGVVFFGDDNNNLGNGGAGVPAAFFTTPAAAAAGAGVVQVRRNRDDIGYIVGGGVEYAFTNNVTARIEGFYVERDGGNRTNGAQIIGVSNTGAPVTAATRDRSDSFGVVRAGLNYKFNLF